MPPVRHCSQGSPGFSLFEMAAVLTIVALVSGMALTLGSAQQESNKVALTKERLDAIEAALIRFAKKGGYLPCPARPSLAPSNASFGASADCTAAVPADIATTTGSGQAIWIGMIPTRSLSLPDDYAFDGWNNRIKYAVIKDLTIAASDTITDYDTSKNTGTGIIQIVDGASTPNQIPSTTEYDIVGYSVVSHGKDGKGAYKKVGGTAGTCTAGYLDTENCDNDAVFVDTFFNDGTVTANYYDDYVRWALLPKLMTETALEQWIEEEEIALLSPMQTYNHTCAIKADTTVWCWGNNGSGRLGDNTTTNSNVPVQVQKITDGTALTGAVQLAYSSDVTCVLMSDGTVYCWGENGARKVGDGTTTDRRQAKQIAAFSGATHIEGSSGGLDAVVLGSCWYWGWNGDPTLEGSASGVFQWVEGDGGNDFWGYLKTDGTVWLTGDNSSGELGDGTTTSRGSYAQVPGLTEVTQLAANDVKEICALKMDGTVWCWGEAEAGAMGQGDNTDQHSPIQVSGLTGITMISGGGWAGITEGYFCAVKDDNTLWCWGDNVSGRLGTGNTTDQFSPVQITAITDVKKIIGTGTFHMCIEQNDGDIYCWGEGSAGELGNSASSDSLTPVKVTGFP